MTTEELVQELNRLRSLTHALTQEIERLLRKVDPASAPSGRHSAAPGRYSAAPPGHKKVPSLQMPAVRPTSRPPKK
jgi:hypothetical protein